MTQILTLSNIRDRVDQMYETKRTKTVVTIRVLIYL